MPETHSINFKSHMTETPSGKIDLGCHPKLHEDVFIPKDCKECQENFKQPIYGRGRDYMKFKDLKFK